MAGTVPRRALAVFLVVAVLPWTLVFTGGAPTVFFTFGFLNLDPLALTTITDYYFTFTAALPRFLNAYGLGVLLFLAGLGSALLGRVGREDERVTAVLFVVAGLSQVWFALGFLRRPGAVALPVGTVLLWGAVWWFYWPPLKAALTGRRVDG